MSDTPNIRSFIEWLRAQGAEEISIGDINIKFGPHPTMDMPDQMPTADERARALRDLYYASS